MNILDVLTNTKVEITVSLFGRDTRMKGKWLGYSKPFIHLKINGVTRLFNEHSIREIIPMEAKKCVLKV